MRLTPLVLAAATAAFPSLVPAQSCAYFPDKNASQGPTSLRPFGSVSTTDPTWADQRMLIFIPKEKLGNAKRTLRSIGFAPAGTRTRIIRDLAIVIQQTDQKASELNATFHKNGSGFTSRFALLRGEWPVTANTWNRLPVRYPFNPARNLLIHVTVRGSGSTGTGAVGFRQDPGLHVVYGKFTDRVGTVARGGPKLELCFDGGFVQTFHDSGCKGSNGKAPRLDLSGSGKLGQSFRVDLEDAPGPSGVAVLVMTIRGYLFGPIDLKDGGAAGCYLRVLPNFITPFPTTGGKASITFPIPNDTALLRLVDPLGFQWFAFDPAANAMKLTSSNWGIVQPGF